MKKLLSLVVVAVVLGLPAWPSWAGFIYQGSNQPLSTTSSPTFAGLSVGTGAITFNDATLVNDGTNTLAQKNGTNAQQFNLYNTFTDAANNERLETMWTGNIAVLRTTASGSGTPRSLQLRYGGTNSVAVQVPTVNTGDILLASTTVTAAATVGRVSIARAFNATAPTGTHLELSLAGGAAPTAPSTMVFRPLSITPTINYSNATPGAGNYDALFVNVTETALPTGPNTLLKLQTSGTDRFVVSNAGAVTAASTIKSTAANDLGWTTQNATNQACNTTCTTGACVFGFNTAALGNLVPCTDSTADSCLCSG
jgi:hypothetical protein